jgi:hypothetical protein
LRNNDGVSGYFGTVHGTSASSRVFFATGHRYPTRIGNVLLLNGFAAPFLPIKTLVLRRSGWWFLMIYAKTTGFQGLSGL